MLKIKDNVDLKELEKFGFKKPKSNFYLWKIIADGYARVLICKKEDVVADREIFLDYYPASITEEQYKKAFEEYKNILFDLIQAGLVEKVADNE